MSDIVIITPTSVLYRCWNGEAHEYQEEEIELDDVISFIWDDVEFRGHITLGRLFEIVKAAPEEWELVLQENIEPLLGEIDKPIPAERDFEGMQYLELSWVAESDVLEGQRDFTLACHFSGCGTVPQGDKSLTDVGYSPGESMGYGIEFIPVNELKDMEVKLDPRVKVAMDSDPQKYLDLGDRNFTLLDLFKGIFWELTFAGTPEKRDAQFEELKGTVDECKRHLSSEEFLKQLETEDEKSSENPIDKTDMKDWLGK